MKVIKDFKEITGNLRDILHAPVSNVMLFFGLLFIVLSFLSLDGLENISLTASPKWIMLIIGCILGVGGLIIFMLTREERRINKKARIEDGLPIKLGPISVNLRLGKIQKISRLDKAAAVVLPANTTFVNDCITDKNSALGAFMLERYPDKIPEITKLIAETLETSEIPKNSDNTYPPGTTIILPPPYNTPARILITAATIRKETVGIRAEPSTICECMHQILAITSDKKISKLYMPILGSGHGGLDINAALLFLLLSIRHYTNRYHHIKSVDIMITENDKRRLKSVNRLQYLTFLKEAGK